MPKKRFSDEQIAFALWQAEHRLAKSVARWVFRKRCFIGGRRCMTAWASPRSVDWSSLKTRIPSSNVWWLTLASTKRCFRMLCKKVVKPARRREMVRHYQDVFDVSERRSCRAMGFGRASHRYQSCGDQQRTLRQRLKELAAARVRYGYRRLHVLLQREGWTIIHKTVYRLYREEGLSIRTQCRKRHRPGRYRSGRSEIGDMNDCWAMDFMSDKLFDDRPFRILMIVDC